VIAVSDSLRQGLAADHGAASVVIPNGVIPPGVRPPGRMAARHGLKAGGYILFLGRLVPEKRADWIIRAFLGRRGGPEGLKLVLAGTSSGTHGYVRSLRSLAGADPRVVFTGEVRGEDKDEIFSNALLFILPSRLEGLPIALLEARGAGLGCLASDIAVHREIVRDGTDGRLFRAADFHDFAARLDELLADPARIIEMGRRAREATASRPDWDEVVRRTVAVYESVRSAARSGKGPPSGR
jgi:glycosyltransferase involved in cell wall biosynthesis